jgi:hypothetical protein
MCYYISTMEEREFATNHALRYAHNTIRGYSEAGIRPSTMLTYYERKYQVYNAYSEAEHSICMYIILLLKTVYAK